MELTEVKTLKYDGVAIGLRFYTTVGVFDADRNSLHEAGLLGTVLKAKLPLLPMPNNMLATQEEVDQGYHVDDISDNKELLNQVVSLVLNHRVYNHLRNFTLPSEQSLKDFMGNHYWQVQPAEIRYDEYKNQNYMLQPDGKQYRGGWIGKGTNLVKVKERFHKEQVYYSIFSGVECFEGASSYKDLKSFLDKVVECKQLVKVEFEENRRISISVNGQKQTFNISDMPKPSLRYALRGFVDQHNLIPDKIKSDPSETYLDYSSIDARELTCIALTSLIYEKLNKRIENPHFKYLNRPTQAV